MFEFNSRPSGNVRSNSAFKLDWNDEEVVCFFDDKGVRIYLGGVRVIQSEINQCFNDVFEVICKDCVA